MVMIKHGFNYTNNGQEWLMNSDSKEIHDVLRVNQPYSMIHVGSG